MAGKTQEIKFPVGGENRKVRYAQTGPAYTTPYAINCRSFGSLERRGRGGSRPGTSKYIADDLGTTITGIHELSYVDGSSVHQTDLIVIVDGLIKVVSGSSVTTTTSYLLLNSGDYLLLNDGTSKIYSVNTVAAVNTVGDVNAFNMAEHGGWLYMAGTTCQYYDPNAGSVQTVENAPTGQDLIAVYRNRLFLGSSHIWRCSRTGDFTDWNVGAKYKRLSRAVSGTTGDGGVIGHDLTCFMPWEDKAILLGTADDLWAIYGNPADDGSGGGKKVNVSHEVGPISQGAMAITDGGLCVFLSRQGVYTWSVGSEKPPERFSESVVPESLRDVSATTNIINIEYDKKENGFYLFVSPDAKTAGQHWFLDLESKAFWRSKYSNNHQPRAIAKMPISGDSNIIMACNDGYLRRHDHSVTNDDGSNLESDIVIGAIRLGGEYGKSGMIQQIFSDMADSSGAITWAIVPADSAEEAIDNAVADIAAGTTTSVRETGTWAANFNKFDYARVRGAWAVIWISSNAVWAYESVSTVIERLGKLRSTS